MANENEKKTQKGASVVPQEYIDRMQEFDIEAWRKQKIADALKYQAERESGEIEPNGWNDVIFDGYDKPILGRNSRLGRYLNCLGTATGAFGQEYRVDGNGVFINPKSDSFHKNKGFAELDKEQEELGDIFVDYHSGSPAHAVMLVGKDKDGNNLYTYGQGERGSIVKSGHYPLLDGKYKRYRFVGTPDEIAQIEAHNAKVRDFQEKTAPLREERKVTLTNAPLDKELDMQRTKRNTIEWLNKLARRK